VEKREFLWKISGENPEKLLPANRNKTDSKGFCKNSKLGKLQA
jgi:hypothetical protein